VDEDLLRAVGRRDRKALAQAISLVEHGSALPELSLASRPPVVGLTGPPGVGKSTLISALIGLIRGRDETVAVLAVDPTSPVTGGALLGDRIRMQGHAGDNGVFIRSMATQGHLGGLAPAAADALTLLALGGFDRLLVETVGVGQSEVEVMRVADVVIVVVGPAWGDEIQAEKAGILEIADIIVINKMDQPGTDAVRRALAETARPRDLDVVSTSALSGEGVEELLAAVDRLSGR
jgi:LAO/AO transport system kinase